MSGFVSLFVRNVTGRERKIHRSEDNTYGSLDHSAAPRGYITATAKDMTVDLILQSPDQARTVLEIAPGETAEIALTAPGKYQYAFASRAEGGEAYCIRLPLQL